MKIVQLGPMPPPHGGVSTNMLAIHDLLTRTGHSSTIIDVTNRNGGSAEPNVLKPRSALGLLKTLLLLDCEIVHFHVGGNFAPRLALLTLVCGMLPGKRSVLTFHSGGYAREAIRFATGRSLRGLALRSVDLVIGVSEQMREMFRAYGVAEKSMRHIPPFELQRPDPAISLPPDLEAFAARSDPLLLSVGALEPEYGNEQLINAMPKVMERFPDAGLMIVGSGNGLSDLLREAAKLGLPDRIRLAGNLERPTVLRLIELADTVLRITDYDGDSIAVREALHLGTPVIASDNAPRPEGVLLLRTPIEPQELTNRLLEAREAQFLVQSDAVSDESNIRSVVEAYKELLAE